MEAKRDKRSVGQRWSEARPTKTVVFWSCVGLDGAHDDRRLQLGRLGHGGHGPGNGGDHGPRRGRHAPGPDLCHAIWAGSGQGQKLVALKDESSWQRGEYVGKQGWATMPGSRSRIAEWPRPAPRC